MVVALNAPDPPPQTLPFSAPEKLKLPVMSQSISDKIQHSHIVWTIIYARFNYVRRGKIPLFYKRLCTPVTPVQQIVLLLHTYCLENTGATAPNSSIFPSNKTETSGNVSQYAIKYKTCIEYGLTSGAVFITFDVAKSQPDCIEVVVLRLPALK